MANIDYRASKQTIGGHIALDLLNTVLIANGELIDQLQSDDDVWQWLADYQLNTRIKLSAGVLLDTTRKLRESIRKLINAKKNNQALNVDAINQFLVEGISHQVLVKSSTGLHIERVREIKSVHQLLAPIAEAAAELLVMEDFSLIRKCESHDCVLWFIDRTKGHKRRWCSMAICGNRHKVSEFRKRLNA